MIKAATIVLNKGPIKLPVVWNMVFHDQSYDCEKAQRRFLQMPVVSVNIDSRVYLCEKKSGMDFALMKDKIMHSLKPAT